MILDEAIKHAEEVAERNFNNAVYIMDKMDKTKSHIAISNVERCKRCAEEHRQLAEWLKDYKRLLEQTRWIPVSERLPKPYQPILVTTNAFYWANEPVKYFVKQINFGGVVDFIAWMPLPEPYREDGEMNDE